MDDDSSELIQQLLIEVRSTPEGREAVKVVERLMNNISSDPNNSKFRSIRTDSNVYSTKIAPVASAGALLGALGWVEAGGRIEYPTSIAPSHLASCLHLLGLGNGAQKGNRPAANAQAIAAGGQNEIARRLRAQMQHVKLYERKDLQDKARKCVPTFILYKQAHAAAQANGGNVRDELMKQLLHWYKNDFFSWMNSPKCTNCQAETQAVGMGQPNADDLKYGAGRVELYRCPLCSTETRFPRYNDPGKLLETRTGRCGEWANCFTLICRALGYDARYVLDFTDHVWTEVYSEGMGRWVHCDSCEAAFDQPLLYEAGWGKKLNYIFAFSAEEVLDVALRYTNNFDDLCTRRNLATESWLNEFVNRCDREQKAALASERRQHRDKMRQKELAELHGTANRSATEEESIGRQSGSLAWREARGETGNH